MPYYPAEYAADWWKMAYEFGFLLAGTAVCVIAARSMAIKRGRAPRIWMWFGALAGPVPLAILAFVPKRS